MVSFDRDGSGSPVVLVHGLGSRRQVFGPILDRLAQRHEVIGLDLPGFGDSHALPEVVPGPRGYAAWLAEWFAGQGIERPHVVGSSMGGGIALELGRAGIAGRVTAFSPIGFYRKPGLRWTQSLLTGVRAAATHGGPAAERLLDYRLGRKLLMAPLFGRPGQVSADAAKADTVALAGAASFAAARDSFDDYVLRSGDDPGLLGGIPVTIAWGTRDVVLTHRTQSTRARSVLPFARHVDLPGCGHLPFSDDPAACADLVLAQANPASPEPS